MTQKRVTHPQLSAWKRAENVQHILLSLIPAMAVLLVGAFGSQMIPSQNELLFCLIFLLGTSFTFIGEKRIIDVVHQDLNRRYAELSAACREFMAGKQETTVAVRGRGELATLAATINLLLDQQRRLLQEKQSHPPQPVSVSSPAQATSSASTPPDDEAKLLNEQLMQVINELAPITKGDLRVRLSLPGNLVRFVADACNSFIEELTQFVKWTRYASQVVSTTSRSALDRSLDMAKNSEDQMHHLSATMNKIEEIALFLQHLSSSFFVHLDVSKEVQREASARMHPAELTGTTPAGQLFRELQRQAEAFEDLLHSAENFSTIAESLIGDLYTIAQHTYQSNVSALKTVKSLNELEALAEHWHHIVMAFTVFEDEEAKNEEWLL